MYCITGMYCKNLENSSLAIYFLMNYSVVNTVHCPQFWSDFNKIIIHVHVWLPVVFPDFGGPTIARHIGTGK